MRIHSIVALAAGGLLAFGSGCRSISDSVTSPSRWVADSSEAFADSSGASADSSNAASDSSSPDDDKEETSYQDDVRIATRDLVAAERGEDDLLREIGRVAERHGVSHWEGRSTTWLALGAGLGEAGLSRPQAQALSRRLAADPRAEAFVLEGYAGDL